MCPQAEKLVEVNQESHQQKDWKIHANKILFQPKNQNIMSTDLAFFYSSIEAGFGFIRQADINFYYTNLTGLVLTVSELKLVEEKLAQANMLK